MRQRKRYTYTNFIFQVSHPVPLQPASRRKQERRRHYGMCSHFYSNIVLLECQIVSRNSIRPLPLIWKHPTIG